MSVLETLLGLEGEERTGIERKLHEEFVIIDVGYNIAEQTATTLRQRKKKGGRDPWLIDAIIAHTALEQRCPLITNNPKDFKAFADLTLIVP